MTSSSKKFGSTPLYWRPSSDVAVARRRAAMLERIRHFFAGRDVLAVDTPALSRFAATDPHIESFGVYSSTGARAEWYLHTSPEFHMKRLLAAGYPDIYSICRVYRDGESGRRHQPEFTLVEWYRLGFGLDAISNETTQFIAAVLERPELCDAVDRIEYRDAFLRYAGVDPFTADSMELAGCVAADKDLRAAIGQERDTWLDLVLSSRVAPKFAQDRLTVLRHYPASQAALARLCPADNSVADRFEVFLGSMELANGCVELTDAAEQQGRIGEECVRRRRLGRPAPPVDDMLIAALDAGLPECSGVALGFERLQMLQDRRDDICQVLTFALDTRHD
ncbi:MAG: EF-P lysine aminoacylase GenX [Proteobacteria bacterium]|nr:EF-P lysine aminoacylase GenX [Pseudomonadota bacterium]